MSRGFTWPEFPSDPILPHHMSLLHSPDPRPVHFVGIAGAGMSALAELFVRRGVAVTGCDANLGEAGDLRALGIPLYEGHDPLHVAGSRALVVTSAMRPDHPELEAARALGIPIVRRAEALGDAVSGGELVAVAGTHGKTTTTTMTTEALNAAGLSPTGVAGGRVRAWNGNLRYGGDRVFVVEADEYDRSFLALAPTVAVVTNVEADHLDIYSDLGDITATFEKFLEPARVVVVCADDAGAAGLRLPQRAERLDYGLGDGARLRASDITNDGGRSGYEAWLDGTPVATVRLSVPGLHNVRNSLAAMAAGIALGADPTALASGLGRFEGVQRRFEHVGEVRGVTIVDDYAHHPTEVAAALEAARAAFPGRRVIAAFQPHLYSRTRDFATAFGVELAAADSIFLAEIYPARENPIEGVSSAMVADAASQAGRPPAWVGARTDLAESLGAAVRDGDVVLTLGAGDITRTGPELLELLRAGK